VVRGPVQIGVDGTHFVVEAAQNSSGQPISRVYLAAPLTGSTLHATTERNTATVTLNSLAGAEVVVEYLDSNPVMAVPETVKDNDDRLEFIRRSKARAARFGVRPPDEG